MDIKTKRIFLIVLLFAMSLSLKANDEIQFSIITIGPYEPELYSAFGHSGIRYLDKKNNIDHFYNYGIFDFNQPNFYINFLNDYYSEKNPKPIRFDSLLSRNLFG